MEFIKAMVYKLKTIALVGRAGWYHGTYTGIIEMNASLELKQAFMLNLNNKMTRFWDKHGDLLIKELPADALSEYLYVMAASSAYDEKKVLN